MNFADVSFLAFLDALMFFGVGLCLIRLAKGVDRITDILIRINAGLDKKEGK